MVSFMVFFRKVAMERRGWEGCDWERLIDDECKISVNIERGELSRLI